MGAHGERCTTVLVAGPLEQESASGWPGALVSSSRNSKKSRNNSMKNEERLAWWLVLAGGGRDRGKYVEFLPGIGQTSM